MDAIDTILAAREAAQHEEARRFREGSARRLDEATARRLRTTMVGSLAEVEAALGYLWGQGRWPDWMPAEARAALDGLGPEFDAAREALRARILDLGNAQIRAARTELRQYDVTWNRHRYQWKAGDAREEGETR